MKWQLGREKYGKIKAGQRWKKKDTGREMTITGTRRNGSFMALFDNGIKSHTINMRDIYAYYDRI